MNQHGFLLVDAGNTAVKSSLLASENLLATDHFDVMQLPNDQASISQLCSQWSDRAAMLNLSPQEVNLVWSSVGPSTVRQIVEQAFFDWSEKSASKPQRAVREQILPCGARVLRNAYDEPSQLGADRWLSALGMASLVARLQLGNHVIVSAGTATTIDLIQVSKNGTLIEFSGGWILPGVSMMHASLRAGTAGLGHDPRLNVQEGWAVPRNSSEAIGHGVALAQSGWIHWIVQSFNVQHIWLHGGARDQWKSYLEITRPGKALADTIRITPDLALRGLACLAACR